VPAVLPTLDSVAEHSIVILHRLAHMMRLCRTCALSFRRWILGLSIPDSGGGAATVTEGWTG